MDARKIYTLVALAAYYNKVLRHIFRVINNVHELLLNYRESELNSKNKDILIWQSVYLQSIPQNKLLEK
jgi:hypothetical protein